jgi:large subunit ribosomal protein L10
MTEKQVASRKVAAVDRLIASMEGRRVVGIARIEGIPAVQLQHMRGKLRDKATLTVGKNRLLALALERAAAKREGIQGLSKVVQGQSALVTSDLNAFRLFKELEATKTKAPARGGEVAPEDISVLAGETPFKPGPIVGELQKAGIPAAIDKGKVVIRQDKVLLRRGERIPREVASVLTRLEIYPLTVGLDVQEVFEDGVVFGRDVLAVDEEKVRADVMMASRQAYNLALYAWIPTTITTRPLLAKAHREALAVATKAGYLSRATAPVLLRMAQAKALRLAAVVVTKEPKAVDEETLKRLMMSATPTGPKPPKGPEEKKKEEEEKVSEEEAAAGLGSLFGS